MARRRGGLLALIALTAAGALLRFWALGHQGLWYDEALTGLMLRRSLGATLHAVPRSESAPPLFYVVAWLWTRVFGDTAVGLRSLSACAGTATIPLAFAAARTLAGRRAAFVAAALVAASPMLIWYSQEARGYALLVAISTLALWLFARARQIPTTTRLLVWALAALAALWTHYFAAFALAPQAALLFGRSLPRLRVRVATAAVLAGAALPLVAIAHRQRGHAPWIASIPLGHRVREAIGFFTVGFRPPATVAWFAVAACAVVLAIALVALRADRAERAGAAWAGVVAGCAVGLPLLAVPVAGDYFDARNVIAGLVPAAIVVAAGLGARRAGRPGIAGAAVLVAVGVALTVTLWRDPSAQRPGWNRVAAAIPRAPRQSAILLRGGSSWGVPLMFALPHTRWAGSRGATVSDLVVVARLATTRCHGRTWWGAVCNIGPVPIVATPVPGAFRLVSAQRVDGFSVQHYRAAAPVLVRVPARHHLLLTAPAPAGGVVTAGRALFVKERCGGCHALRAVGAKGGQGPSFDAARERLSPAQLRRALTEGANGMPSYAGRLSSRQLDELTAFLVTLGR